MYGSLQKSLWVLLIPSLLISDIGVLANFFSEFRNSSDADSVIGRYIVDLQSRIDVNPKGSVNDIANITEQFYANISNIDQMGVLDAAKVIKDYMKIIDIHDKFSAYERSETFIDRESRMIDLSLGMNFSSIYFDARDATKPGAEGFSQFMDKYSSNIISPGPLKKGLLDLYNEFFSEKLKTTTNCMDSVSYSKAIEEASKYWTKVITSGYLHIMKLCYLLWKAQEEDAIVIATEKMEEYRNIVTKIGNKTVEILTTILELHLQCQKRQL